MTLRFQLVFHLAGEAARCADAKLKCCQFRNNIARIRENACLSHTHFCSDASQTSVPDDSHACTFIHTNCKLSHSVVFWKGQRSELPCDSSAEQWVCVCGEEGVVWLIQVLSRRGDKNLLPACWASESANRRELDPNNLCPGPARLMTWTSYKEHGALGRQKATCGRESAGIHLM